MTGLAALLGLLALLVGAPLALALLVGNPLPDHLLTGTEITDALMRPDDSGQLFIAVLTIIGWIAWAAFAVPIVVEALARLRGVRTPRLPLLGTPQRVAAGLLAAIGLMIASPAIAASTPAYAAPPAAASMRAVAVVQHTAIAPAAETAPARHTIMNEKPDTPLVYKVAKGDNLSKIAERFLDDENRYPEIAHKNPLLEKRDERFPDHIEATWRLTLPDDAVDQGADDHARGTVVRPTTAAPAPAEQHGPTEQPNTATPPTAAPTAEPVTPEPAAPTAEAPAPVATAPAPAATAPTATVPVTPAAEQDSAAADGQDDVAVVPVTAAIAGMGVLAALTLLALRRRRARQQQHRRARRRIARPAAGETEAKLHVAAASTDLDRLDIGLRALGAGLADRPDEQWPDVVAAWLEYGAIHLVLTESCGAPPAPWLSDGDTIWTLPATVELPDTSDQLAPLPTLVAVGSQPDQHLLVDLERLGMLTVTGDPERALDLLRYLAAELAHNRWSDDVQIVLAGFDPDEAHLLAQINPDRVAVAASTEAAVTKLRRQLGDTRDALTAVGSANTVHGRATDSGEAWPPQVLLIANPTTEQTPMLTDLEKLLVAVPSSGFAAVVAGTIADETPCRWPITVTADGQLTVSFLTDSPLIASGLPAAMLQPLAELLSIADSTDDEATPPAPDTEEWAVGTDAAGGLQDMLDIADDEHPAGKAHDGEPGVGEMARPVQITVRNSNLPTVWNPAAEPVLLTLRPAAADPATAQLRRQEREHRDPNLDTDLAAWVGNDPTRPRIGILGVVELTASGLKPKNRHGFYAEIVVYLAARGARGATAAQLADAIWREQVAASSTRRSAISRARRWLGDAPDGDPWMPQMTGDHLYRIVEGYLFDWALFRRLRARGEARGDQGAGDLRQALELVRGAPFDGVQDAYTAERTAYAWLADSEIAPTHLVASIVDTAHQLVDLNLATGDLVGARWALDRAWRADPDRNEDQPWRDAMRIAHADNRDSELKALVQDLLRHRDVDFEEDLDPETFQLVEQLKRFRHRAAS